MIEKMVPVVRLFFLANCFLFAVAFGQQTPPPGTNFRSEVYPIFQRSCFACHAGEQQMGKLRLDTRTAVFQGGLSGNTVIPHQPGRSELYRRVAGIGGQARMPMGGKLAEEEIAVIRRWIEQGAPWPEDVGAKTAELKTHWAFVPPVRPELPAVRDDSWASNPIDRFVLARLEKEALIPSSEAERTTLLRRLSLDLIGLPPTIQETDAFLADRSPEAYAKQVERLLESPHYGERWGRIWLDAARYADSDGFEKDKPREVWFYRDWVIDALNRDMPYDQFIVEQLAGDLLPGAKQTDLVATGFLRNSMINEEGGIDPEQFRMEAMFDRLDAIGKSILGITIQCAQCHNHKFDPLTQEEYYRILAFLNNSYEANVKVYSSGEEKQRAAIFSAMDAIEEELKRATPDWRERMAAWESKVRDDQPEWSVVRPEVDDISNGGQKYYLLEDGSFLAQGYAPTRHRVMMTVKTEMTDIRGFRLELLNHPNLPGGGPGRSIYGTAALTEFEVEAAPASAPEKSEPVWFKRATADVNPPVRELDPKVFPDKENLKRTTGPVDFAIDDCEDTAWTIDNGAGRRNEPRNAVFEAGKPISHEGGTVLTFYLSQRHGGWNSDDNQNNNLGRFRLSITNAAGVEADRVPLHVREILSVAPAMRTPAQERAVFRYWRTTVPDWAEANAKIEKLWERYPEGSKQLVMREREQMRETSILERGDFLKPKKQVDPGVPAFLNPLPANENPTRLDFARWLVDRQSPTTARSIVNRVWQAYFGMGLVPTAENLGTQSEPPSHPELLDWLAVDFMERGWSLKNLHRQIVMSRTYRQSSRVTPELLAKDPNNRLLTRGPRFRVDAEIVRDIALTASGLLNRELGGPPVYPPAPEFLFLPPVSYGPKIWDTEQDGERYRRAVYTFRYRSVPYPVLDTFDAPNGDASTVKRARSNTPLQALATLNETLFMESARALALKSLTHSEDERARLEYAFRRCLTRKPEERESRELLAVLQQQRERFASGGLDAWEFAANDPAHPPKLPSNAKPEDLAAWTVVSRILLNLDETITKE